MGTNAVLVLTILLLWLFVFRGRGSFSNSSGGGFGGKVSPGAGPDYKDGFGNVFRTVG